MQAIAMVMTAAVRREINVIRLGSFMLNLHQWPGRFQIGRANGPSGPVCQGARQTQRVITDILRKDARTHDEHIVDVPCLQKSIDDTTLGIISHDRSADIVRGLVYSSIVMITELIHFYLYLH